jgi:hypothetical protein
MSRQRIYVPKCTRNAATGRDLAGKRTGPGTWRVETGVTEGKKRKDAQQSKKDEESRPGEDEEEKDAQQSDDDPESRPRKDEEDFEKSLDYYQTYRGFWKSLDYHWIYMI